MLKIVEELLKHVKIEFLQRKIIVFHKYKNILKSHKV